MSIAISGSTPASNPLATAASHKEAGKAQGSDSNSSSSSSSSQQITNQVTTTNPDGSTTTVITYANGTTSTTSQQAPASTQAAAGKGAQPNQAGPQAAGGLLDPTNLGQNAALLAAQEKAKQG